MTRREAREQAFVLLFEKSFQPEIGMDELIAVNIENGQLEDDEFANGLACTAWEKVEKIDARIEKCSIGWKKNRIAKVSLAVLRVAVCEMMFYDDIPVGVSINEAVELCKKYASAEEYSFVNGVLGAAAKLEEAQG